MATDASAYLQGILDQYGLSSLVSWAWQMLQAGASEDEIIQQLRQRPEYEARFPGLNQMRQTGRAVSENQWIEYEQRAVGAMREAGLPTGFYDQPSDIGRFITGEVSLDELEERIQMAEESTLSVSQQARQQWAEYGYSPGDLTATFLNPDVAEPILRQQWVAAQTSATAMRAGFGALARQEAEQVGGLVQSQQEAEQGLSRLAANQELFNPLDRGETAISRQTQLTSEFGSNAEAQAEIERRQRRRLAYFNQGGGFATGQEGLAVGAQRV